MGHTLEQPRMIAEFLAAGVQMHPGSTATGWDGNGLTVVRSDTGASLPIVQGASLIHVGIRHPDLTLSQALNERVLNHRLIGDAECPGIIQSAVYSGHRHAREILGQTSPFLRERAELI
jgi:dimethylamine/trimethylamine dehydrogenase